MTTINDSTPGSNPVQLSNEITPQPEAHKNNNTFTFRKGISRGYKRYSYNRQKNVVVRRPAPVNDVRNTSRPQKTKVSLPQGTRYTNWEFYEIIADQDAALNYDINASRIQSVLRATNQWNPQTQHSVKTTETIMLCNEQDPDQDRIDPTYKVDYDQSHCNAYEIKLIKTMVKSYPDIFVQYMILD